MKPLHDISVLLCIWHNLGRTTELHVNACRVIADDAPVENNTFEGITFGDILDRLAVAARQTQAQQQGLNMQEGKVFSFSDAMSPSHCLLPQQPEHPKND